MIAVDWQHERWQHTAHAQLCTALLTAQWKGLAGLSGCRIERVRATLESSSRRGSYERIYSRQEFWNFEI